MTAMANYRNLSSTRHLTLPREEKKKTEEQNKDLSLKKMASPFLSPSNRWPVVNTNHNFYAIFM